MIVSQVKSRLLTISAVFMFVLAFWGLQYARRGYWEPDEARFVYIAREMVESNSPFVPLRNGEIYAHKPPLMMWLITAGETVLGKPFGSRLPVLLGTFLSLLSFFSIARRLTDKTTAKIALLLLATSADFWFDMGRGQIDPLLTGFVLSSVALFPFDKHGRICTVEVIPSAILSGLAIFAKGPVGLVLPILILLALTCPFGYGRESEISIRHILIGIFIALSVPILWLCTAALSGAPAEYFYEIVFKQTFSRVAGGYGHIKPFYYYLPVFLQGFMPWIFILPAAVRILWNENRQLLVRCGSWTVFVLIFFSLSVSKRSVYVLTAYPAAALIVAAAASRLRGTRPMTIFTWAVAIVLPLLLMAAGIFFANPNLSSRIFPDDFDYSHISTRLSLIFLAAEIFVGLCSLLYITKRLPLNGVYYPMALTLIVYFFIGNYALPEMNPVKEPLSIKLIADKYIPEGEPLLLYHMNGETLALHANRRGREVYYTYDLLVEMARRGKGLVIVSERREERVERLFPVFIRQKGKFSMGKKRYVWLAFDTRDVDVENLDNVYIKRVFQDERKAVD